MEWLDQLNPWFADWSYLAVFIVLVLSGVGLPLPEEATFIAAGIATVQGGGSVCLMICVGVAGLLLGDSLIYVLGRYFGPGLLKRWPFRRFINEKTIEKSRHFFEKHGSMTVFLAGFVAGVRATTYFFSGTMKLKFYRFLFWDLMRALITCPISIWLGWKFGPQAIGIIHAHRVEFFSLLGVVAVVCIVRVYLQHKKPAPSAPAPLTPPEPALATEVPKIPEPK